MFDVSWIEILFIGALAILVVGPKDLPKLFRLAGSTVRKAQKMYRGMLSSLNQLEREIDIAEGGQKDHAPWLKFVPEEVKQIYPDDYLPGSMTVEQIQEKKNKKNDAIAQAKAKWETEQETTQKAVQQQNSNP